MASRESYDLFRFPMRTLRAVRQHPRSARTYLFRDTFTRWLCALSGGCEFYLQPDVVNAPEELFCCWCRKRKPSAAGREEIDGE